MHAQGYHQEPMKIELKPNVRIDFFNIFSFPQISDQVSKLMCNQLTSNVTLHV